VLIPKTENPEYLKKYRPISLCNVLYKVASKCLVNRLQPLLHDIIAPTQSVFIPDRMITDNTLIAFECLHAIKNGNGRCKNFGAYKLNLTKAYDRVDWGYLKGVLMRLGFHNRWIQWVMECVTTVEYTVRLNNVQLDPFKPSHCLRQGDPLSPYLFLLWLMDCLEYYRIMCQMVYYTTCKFVGWHQASHIFFLQTILCCFLRLQKSKLCW
jgi:hypothetical protein